MSVAFDLLTLAAELNGDEPSPTPAPTGADLVDGTDAVVPVRAHTRRVRPRTTVTQERVARSVPAPPPTDTTPAWLPSKAERAAARQRDYERLEPIALRLAMAVGATGFTVDNLRRAAIKAGVITGDEGKGKDADRQRALSWLGPFLTSLARRGLIAPLTYPDGHKVKRYSDRPEAHANAHVVYVSVDFVRPTK